MIFAKVRAGVILEYPITESELRKLYPEVVLSADLSNCEYLMLREWVSVHETPRPVIDSTTQFITDGTPELVSGIWQQRWVINDHDAATIAANQAEHQQQIKQHLDAIITQHIDATARSLGYENRLSICTYLTSNVAKFRNEATAFITWRDIVWQTCMQIQDDVVAGTRLAPTAETILSELPVFSI